MAAAAPTLSGCGMAKKAGSPALVRVTVILKKRVAKK
jgi:hypothetical protein